MSLSKKKSKMATMWLTVCINLLLAPQLTSAVDAQSILVLQNGYASDQACSTSILASAVPSATALALQQYSYCGGTLNVSAYIENIDYDKIVTLYYTNADGDSTPLSAIQLGYSNSIDNTNYEIWDSSTPDVNLDGIQQLLNVTYQATDVDQTYVQQLNEAVTASGPAPTTSTIPAPYASPTGFSSDITNWLAPRAGSEAVIAKNRMFNNIEVIDAANGTIVAAQSYANPDYGYNWVRDSSLTMDVVATLYGASSGTYRTFYQNLFFRYAKARATEQNDPNLQTGLGEPKFNLDNSVFTGPWGRPQNDGPATAAITLMEFANSYIKFGGTKSAINMMIYNSKTHPRQSPVMRDLLFVANNWTSPSFDLWEEESSDHFYTRMVQHRALVMGSQFASTLGDSATASTLSSAASDLAATLPQFWDSIRQLVLYEYGPVLRGKYSYKDAAVVLGLIHGYAGDGIYAYNNDQILSTVVQLVTSFIPVFPIAGQHTDDTGRVLGTPVGRYPEDTYNGVETTSQGNPWYLCTASVAEFMYRAAMAFQSAGKITVSSTSAPFWNYYSPQSKVKAGRTYTTGSPVGKILIASLQGWGDAYMRTVKYYTPGSGHLSEEIDRTSGQPVGAIDLTWSYAALLTASFARAQATGNTGYITSLANMATTTNSTAAMAS